MQTILYRQGSVIEGTPIGAQENSKGMPRSTLTRLAFV
jgi:hypothetical protein